MTPSNIGGGFSRTLCSSCGHLVVDHDGTFIHGTLTESCSLDCALKMNSNPNSASSCWGFLVNIPVVLLCECGSPGWTASLSLSLSPAPFAFVTPPFIQRLWEQHPLTVTFCGLKSFISVGIISAFASLASAGCRWIQSGASDSPPGSNTNGLLSLTPRKCGKDRLKAGGFDRSQKVTVTQRWIL